MTYEINGTHDPNLKSWVESANDPTTDFPIQNLPFCVFDPDLDAPVGTGGVAIGGELLDISECPKNDILAKTNKLIGDYNLFFVSDLYEGLPDPKEIMSTLRHELIELLSENAAAETIAQLKDHLYTAS